MPACNKEYQTIPESIRTGLYRGATDSRDHISIRMLQTMVVSGSPPCPEPWHQDEGSLYLGGLLGPHEVGLQRILF